MGYPPCWNDIARWGLEGHILIDWENAKLFHYIYIDLIHPNSMGIYWREQQEKLLHLLFFLLLWPLQDTYWGWLDPGQGQVESSTKRCHQCHGLFPTENHYDWVIDEGNLCVFLCVFEVLKQFIIFFAESDGQTWSFWAKHVPRRLGLCTVRINPSCSCPFLAILARWLSYETLICNMFVSSLSGM